LASKKLNILILGGNGFIGSHLVEALKNKHQVTVFDKSPNLFIKEYAEVNYVYGDFGNTDLLSKVLDNKHVVYHLLSTTVPYSADINPIFDIESNLIGTVKLLDMIVEKGIQRFVYASSGGTVYGKSHYLPMDEEHPCNPLGSYGIVKNTVERYIMMYASKNQFSYLIARPSNPYGPRQNYTKNQGLIAKLIYSGMHQEEVTIWGDGSATRDYIYIDDLTNFLTIAGLSNESGVFNVGSGTGMSINQIIESLSSIIEHMPAIVYTDKKGSFVDKVALDIKYATEKFDWTPKIPLEKGLRHHHKWMKLNCKV
jgi:UDP-glucose 4-epimerase